MIIHVAGRKLNPDCNLWSVEYCVLCNCGLDRTDLPLPLDVLIEKSECV